MPKIELQGDICGFILILVQLHITFDLCTSNCSLPIIGTWCSDDMLISVQYSCTVTPSTTQLFASPELRGAHTLHS